jgi:hypothetical protein
MVLKIADDLAQESPRPMLQHRPDGINARLPSNAAVPRADPSAQEKLAKLLVLKNLQCMHLIRLQDKGNKPPQLH